MKNFPSRSKWAQVLEFVRVGVFAVSTVSVLGLCGTAAAFEFNTGNDDIKLRWDNTLRYTLAQRVKGQNQNILNSPNNDDGDRNFNVGIVSNRLDLLSELDFSYKSKYGVRVSGAGWYDQRYSDHLDNTSTSTSNHLVNGVSTQGFSNYVDRKFAGPNGELLDAFAFGGFSIAGTPVNVKAGRHTIFWGEAMFSGGGTHGISYAQSPIDVGKAMAQPGVELKELFRPLNQISLKIQPRDDLTIAAQYYLQWEANRLPEPGTYLGFADMLGNGAESLLLPLPTGGFAPLPKGGDIKPRQSGDWGVSLRYNPEWLDGTLGVYYRDFSDKGPQMHLSMAMTPVGPVPTSYNWAYADNIHLYGVSLAKQIFGASIGTEVSYRTNMPLISDAAIIGPFPGTTASALPSTGTLGARGETLHALVNAMYLVSNTPMFDTGTFITEFVFNRIVGVTSHPELYRGTNSYSAIDKPTKDFFGGEVAFTPTWFQVLPGVDLSMPLDVNIGLSGNSGVAVGGNKNAGAWSAGISADIYTKYKAELKYVANFGTYDVTPAGVVGNGVGAMLKDRDMVVMTLKTTF